jgi:hypothetical protein
MTANAIEAEKRYKSINQENYLTAYPQATSVVNAVETAYEEAYQSVEMRNAFFIATGSVWAVNVIHALVVAALNIDRKRKFSNVPLREMLPISVALTPNSFQINYLRHF